MSPQAPPQPSPNSQAPNPLGPEPLPPGPPEEEFWDKYSKHLEFPLSAFAAIFLHVLVGALLIFILVPLVFVEPGGMDDEGLGSAGSGGDESDLKPTPDPFKQTDPTPMIPNIPDPIPMPTTLTDPTAGALPIPKSGEPPKVRERGAGKEQGRGFDDSKGKGPGGSGADSTRARSLRWTMRFR